MRKLLLVGALLLVAVIGAALGLLSIGFGGQQTPGHAVAEGQGSEPFTVGSCLYGEGSAGAVSLRPASCDGDQAVFVVNAVVGDDAGCDRIADFSRYGAVQHDASANVVYCLSLVLERNACVVLGPDVPAHQVDCGTDPAASRVAQTVTGTRPAAACSAVRGSDVWYSRSPSSGQIACLVPDGR